MVTDVVTSEYTEKAKKCEKKNYPKKCWLLTE